jgi:hypothetical protein
MVKEITCYGEKSVLNLLLKILEIREDLYHLWNYIIFRNIDNAVIVVANLVPVNK